MTDELEKRQRLTFSQAEGLAELPRQLKRDEMPKAFRNDMWTKLYSLSQGAHRTEQDNKFWLACSRYLWIRVFQRPVDEFTSVKDVMDKCKNIILNHPYNEVFDLLTALVKRVYDDHGSIQVLIGISIALKDHQMAYYLDTSGLPTFMPLSTQEEGDAVRGAMQDLADAGMDGARTHLRKAAEAINKNEFADAVRESISAVESVAKVVSGGEKQTLVNALKVLEDRGLLSHKALSEAFQKLYGYTSDEKGIRHSLLDEGAANVGEEEAVFMFGACASFCGYLCRKQNKMAK